GAAEQFIEVGAKGQIALYEGKRPCRRLKVANVGLLDPRIVKVVQIVEGPDRVAVAQQPFADVVADESCAAGDQEIHVTIMECNVECSRFNIQDSRFKARTEH